MRYVSPFALFELEATQTEVTEKDLFLRKRKLLSEFELFNTTTIEVNGQPITKNDVLNMFSTFEKEPNLNFHLVVAKDKVLVYFLEHHQIEFKTTFSIPPGDLTDAFTEWLSPYFKSAFSQTLMTAIQTRDLHTFNTLMMNPRYMTPEDEMLAWQPAQKFFDDLIYQLSDINNAQTHAEHQWEIREMSNQDMLIMFKNLPVERFQSQINAYACELMRASLSIFSFDRPWSLGLINDALTLPVSEETREILEEKQAEIDAAFLQGHSNGGSGKSDWSFLWVLVRIIVFLVFVGGKFGNGCNSSPDYNFTSPAYDQQTSQVMIKDIMENASKKSTTIINDNIVSFLTTIEEKSQQFETGYGVTQKYLHTGNDPYSDIWNTLTEQSNGQFEHKSYVYNNNHSDTTGMAKFLLSPYTSLSIKNKSDFNAIVIMNRGDSVFSAYIKAGAEWKFPILKDCESYAFVYAGKKFVYLPAITAKVNFSGTEKEILLPGGFTDLTGQNSAFMRQSIPLKNISSFTITNEDNTKIAVKLNPGK